MRTCRDRKSVELVVATGKKEQLSTAISLSSRSSRAPRMAKVSKLLKIKFSQMKYGKILTLRSRIGLEYKARGYFRVRGPADD
jgi:hypothetical protein